jgi:hypothetical protein
VSFESASSTSDRSHHLSHCFRTLHQETYPEFPLDLPTFIIISIIIIIINGLRGLSENPIQSEKNKNKQNIWFQVTILPRTNPLTSSSQKWLNNWPQNQLSH